jgi:thiamine biosynthesis lipoprotein
VTDSPRQSRRDFLRGRTAVKALAGAVTKVHDVVTEAIGADSPLVAMPTATPLVSYTRRAMACDFEVQVPAGRDAATAQHLLDALDLLEPLEAQMTIYRSESEVLRINSQAADGPVTVESRLFALFQLAERLHRETDGALDITTGPLSAAWGFSRREGRMPSDSEISAVLANVGMNHVELDAANETVAFRRPGVSLHLNCIGKGYALDRMAETLAERGVDEYLLHGGRSSVLARGSCPGSELAGWAIGLRHPLRPEERLGEFLLVNQALGTSGSGTQSFEHDGRRYGHLLDPRTGRPVENIFTATVLAPTAAEADALSTAFYIMGPARTAEYCASRPEIAAMLVCPADAESGVRLHALNFDETRWRPTVDG